MAIADGVLRPAHEMLPQMKPIIQSEAAECGLACLAMIANHHGCGTDLRSLRQRFPQSLKGASLSRIISQAGTLGLAARPLRLELEGLRRLATPCILHWDLNHFVVMIKAGRSGIVIADPAYGTRPVSYAEASQHFTGVALELTPTAQFAQSSPRPAVSLRRLTGPITGLRRALGQILMLSLTVQVFMVLAPFYLQWVVDQVLVSSDRQLLAVIGIGFALLMLLQVATQFLRGLAVAYLSNRIGLQWTGNVFAHLLRLPLDFFQKRHLGDVVSRMNSVHAIQQTLTTNFVEAIIDGLMAMVTLAMMLAYSSKLSLVTLAVVVLYLGIRLVVFSPLFGNTERQLVAAANQHTFLMESIRGMQSLKVAGCEDMRRARYLNRVNETVNLDLRLARLGVSFTSISQLVFGVERVVVIWIGVGLALENVFSVGMLMAYIAYKDQFAQRMSGLIDKLIDFRMLRLHAERLADVVLTPPEEQIDTSIALQPASARIEVRSLSFRYADGEPRIVQDCNFAIEPGESVAIVGSSGCGKSTLIKLMLGLLSPDSGAIEYGGIELRKLGPMNYRPLMGAVMQDDQLFAGTIADNIALGDENFDQTGVEAVARMAAIHEEITAMPMGYQTLIGDMGTTLSGGQKQRVILARALYREPHVLFLDEATSHLDVRRECAVNDAVRALAMTRIIVAHRPETIASADRVLVMESGRIVHEYRPQSVHAGDGTATSECGLAAVHVAAPLLHVVHGAGGVSPTVG